jgi:hypothetical protein
MVKTAPFMFVLFAAVSLTTAFAETAFAKEPNGIGIRVLIENIRYEGKDAYSLVVSTSNASSRDVLVRIIEEGFFIQTDRGWAQLNVLNGINREREEFLLPHVGKNVRAASISIPLTMPDLFRTYEGDLSLMYKYTYTVRTADGTGAALQRADEVYCWVKPGTSQWILREGM